MSLNPPLALVLSLPAALAGGVAVFMLPYVIPSMWWLPHTWMFDPSMPVPQHGVRNLIAITTLVNAVAALAFAAMQAVLTGGRVNMIWLTLAVALAVGLSFLVMRAVIFGNMTITICVIIAGLVASILHQRIVQR